MKKVDIAIIGAGPVGLMCAYLAQLCGLSFAIIDKSAGTLEVGRADALNARTLQLFEVVKLFDDIYPLGKTCNTSSVWSQGKFISRQSSWWDELEGCLHKHFLMIGQSYVEKLLDSKLEETKVKRLTEVKNIVLNEGGCLTELSNGEQVQSKYLIGADGSRSFVRNHFKIPFEITRPQIIWAVIDGIIESDFPKVPEIIVFQAETSDVAWIPREGNIDRFYVRMDVDNFTFEEVMKKINHAIRPHHLNFKEVIWFSQFSVKESVAEKFFFRDRIFLVGDSCHVHSVNGGQGLNTGLADAFNLIWKINMVLNFKTPQKILQSYEEERKPVALSVIKSSGELVRSTKYSLTQTHAQDYVRIVQKYAGNITGMGVSYYKNSNESSRLFDFEVFEGDNKTRLYSLLSYAKYTLFLFGTSPQAISVPENVNVIQIFSHKEANSFWTQSNFYQNKAVLVRPDAYIQTSSFIDQLESIFI